MEYLGATQERQKHGKIRQAERDHRIGKGYGHQEQWPTLLDYLYDNDMLGHERDKEERYNAGYKIMELWYSFNRSGKDISTLMMSNPGKQFVTEGETIQDISEERYHAVMRALPIKYTPTVWRAIIHSNATQDTIEMICDCLDALTGAFYRVERG